MTGVRVSEHYGIVIRKTALEERRITVDKLLSAMEASAPLDEDQNLISFGPHFGGEAAQEFTRRLEALGLVYGDDFLDFALILPEWCSLYVALKVTDR
jgi:hypothetical protein